MRGLDRILAFDAETGLLRAEAGLSLNALMQLLAPRMFFPATCPGTRFVTLGGAVANDVHGKNHHRAGAFGCTVEGLTLLRSDRGVVATSEAEEPELFAATIGGLGLNGVILDVTLRMSQIPSTFLDVETLPIGIPRDFFALSRASAVGYEHTVSWVDCTARGARTGRGLFQRANWSFHAGFRANETRGPRVPLDAPGFVLNRWTVRAFNELYAGSTMRPSFILWMPSRTGIASTGRRVSFSTNASCRWTPRTRSPSSSTSSRGRVRARSSRSSRRSGQGSVPA